MAKELSVKSVDRGSEAESIGLLNGSIIKSINGQAINCKDDFDAILRSNLNKTIQISWHDSSGNEAINSITIPKSVGAKPLGIELTDIPINLNSKNLQNLNYTAYVTHDEGSNFDIAFKELRLQERIFGDWFDTITVIAYLDTIVGISILIFLPYAHHIRKISKSEQAKSLSHFLQQIITARNTLETDRTTTNEIPETWTSTIYATKRRIIDNTNDYLATDNFFTKLYTSSSKKEL